MADDLTLELATLEDVDAIMGLFAECFPQQWRDLNIYGCEGAAAFLADSIRWQAHRGETAVLVARSDQVLGFMEVRRTPSAINVNNAATSPKARGLGLFRRLLAAAVELGEREGYAMTTLHRTLGDPLKDFYHRTGYTVVFQMMWSACPLPDGPMTVDTVFHGLPQADAIHARYGFSQFTLRTRLGLYDVGRLGTRWFRLRNPAIVRDEKALSALHNLDPERELLCFVDAGSLPAHLGFRQVLAMEHMEGAIPVVLQGLKGGGQA